MGSLFDRLESIQNSDQPENSTPSISNNNIKRITPQSYRQLKDIFDANQLGTFKYLIDSVEKTRDKKFQKEAKKVLINILNETNGVKISYLMLELQNISKYYNQEKTTTIRSAQKDQQEEKAKLGTLDVIGNFFFSSDEVAEIEDIDIGEASSVKEFQEKLKRLVKYIEKTDTFQNWTTSQQDAFTSNILNIGEYLEEGENIQNSNIEEVFDNYAEEIASQEEGTVYLSLLDDNISFPSKQEAFDYIKKLKKVAEWKFQSGWLYALEAITIGLATIFTESVDVLTAIPRFNWHMIKGVDLIGDFGDDTTGSELFIDGIITTIAIFTTLNYIETLSRRVGKDILAKMDIKTVPFITEKVRDENGNIVYEEKEVKDKKGNTKKIKIAKKRRQLLVIPDFSKMDKNQILSGNHAVLYNDYLQRIYILDSLQEELDTLSGKEAEVFKAHLNNVKSLLNVNTKSFYLDAFALKKGIWNPKKVWWALRNGVVSFPFQDLSQKAQTEFNTEKTNIIKNYNKGIDLLFNEGTVSQEKDKGKIKIDVNIQKDNYSIITKQIFAYIQSLNISGNEKNDRIQRMQNFLKSLSTRPRTDEYIKKELYAIVKNGKLDTDEVKAILDKKLITYIPIENKLSNKSLQEWLKYLPRETIDEIVDKYSKIAGNRFPASLTRGQAGLIQIKYFVDNGMLEINNSDLKILISEIESGKIELNRLYDGISGKLLFTKDMGIKVFMKIIKGDAVEFTKMKRYNAKILEKDWSDFVEEGKKALKNIDLGKEILTGEVGKSLQNIFDLDSIKFPEDKEKEFEKMFTKLKEQADIGTLTQEQIKIEIIKMYDGEIINIEAIRIIEESGMSDQNNVKDLKEKIETNKWYGTPEEFQQEFNRNISDSNYRTNEKIKNISDIDAGIESIKQEGIAIGKKHFRDEGFGIFVGEKRGDGRLTIFDGEDFKKNEGALSQILNFEQNLNIDRDLGILSQTINSGIDSTSEEFFAKLNNIFNTNISIDENTTRNTFKSNLKLEVSDFFNNLDSNSRFKLLEFIKNSDISNNILPENLKNALNSNVTSIQNVFNSLKTEFDDGIDIERQKEIRIGLTKLLQEEGITDELITEINSLKGEINKSIFASGTTSSSSGSSKNQPNPSSQPEIDDINTLTKNQKAEKIEKTLKKTNPKRYYLYLIEKKYPNIDTKILQNERLKLLMTPLIEKSSKEDVLKIKIYYENKFGIDNIQGELINKNMAGFGDLSKSLKNSGDIKLGKQLWDRIKTGKLLTR